MQAALIGPSGQIILGASGLTMGRMQRNQFVVYDRKVSAHHAVISSLKEGTYTITDKGSTNRTLVNGLLLSQNVPYLLHSGDTIHIGDTILTFQISNTSEKQDTPASDYVMNNTWHTTTVSPSQKIDEKPPLKRKHESLPRIVTPSTKGHRRILVSQLGSEKIIADNLSNVKGCTYKISKEPENFAVVKINFTGLSGQLVSGKMLLVKDSNDTWKIDDLQNI